MMLFVRSVSWLLFLAAGIISTDRLYDLFAAVPSDAPLQWWASRGTGFVAYVALWLSMMLGLMISSRGLDGTLNRKTVLEAHQQWTLAAVVATLFHVAVIVSDPYVEMDWMAAAIPGASVYLPGPVAMGTLAMWGVALLAVSSWLQRQMNYTVWRVIHTSALGTFVLGLLHGILAGSDSEAAVAQLTYATTAAFLLGAIVFRAIYTPMKAKAAAKPPGSPRVAQASPPAAAAPGAEAAPVAEATAAAEAQPTANAERAADAVRAAEAVFNEGPPREAAPSGAPPAGANST